MTPEIKIIYKDRSKYEFLGRSYNNPMLAPTIRPEIIILNSSLYWSNIIFINIIAAKNPAIPPDKNKSKYDKSISFTALIVLSYVPNIKSIDDPLIPGNIMNPKDKSPDKIII